MKINKNTRRLLLITIISLSVYSIAKLSFSYETIIDNKLHFTLPAAVSVSDGRQFDYPDIFKSYAQENFEVSAYEVNLLTKNKDTYGYVEVWKTNESLSVCLEKSKAAFGPEINDFKEAFPNGDVNLREWQYSVTSTDGDEIRSRQYFSKKDGNIIVVSLFAPKNVWSPGYDDIFNEIKDSAFIN